MSSFQSARSLCADLQEVTANLPANNISATLCQNLAQQAEQFTQFNETLKKVHKETTFGLSDKAEQLGTVNTLVTLLRLMAVSKSMKNTAGKLKNSLQVDADNLAEEKGYFTAEQLMKAADSISLIASAQEAKDPLELLNNIPAADKDKIRATFQQANQVITEARQDKAANGRLKAYEALLQVLAKHAAEFLTTARNRSLRNHYEASRANMLRSFAQSLDARIEFILTEFQMNFRSLAYNTAQLSSPLQQISLRSQVQQLVPFIRSTLGTKAAELEGAAELAMMLGPSMLESTCLSLTGKPLYDKPEPAPENTKDKKASSAPTEEERDQLAKSLLQIALDLHKAYKKDKETSKPSPQPSAETESLAENSDPPRPPETGTTPAPEEKPEPEGTDP